MLIYIQLRKTREREVIKMKGSTERLFREMLYNKECADYIQNGWNCLYHDIIACAGNWDELDKVSAMALLDWHER